MNILVFSPIVSHPQNEGNCKRIFTLTKYLQSLGHKIHFVYFTQGGVNKKNFELMLNEWDTFTFIEMINPIQYKKGNYKLDEWYQKDIGPIVNQIIYNYNINMILMNYLMQSKQFENIPPHVLKVIDTHDRFTDRYKLYERPHTPEYVWYSISKEDEIRGLNRSDVILAIQDEEADYFTSIVKKPVITVNHLEQKHFFDRDYSSLKKIGFVGSGNEINVHAMNAFFQVFINSELSKNIQIILAGNICNCIDIQDPCIIRRGIVDDLKSFYAEVDLIINPLLFGTGLKIKSVEALSYGVPIVSTRIGFEGIVSGETCHRLDSHVEMLQCIESIASNPELLEILHKSSRDIFEVYEYNVLSKIDDLLALVEMNNATVSRRPRKNPLKKIRAYKHLMEIYAKAKKIFWQGVR